MARKKAIAMELDKIAFGGGCHWCTEAVFQSLKGVKKVQQGYVASTGKHNTFSEAIIVHFYPEIISEKTVLQVHLHTHKSTKNHSFRDKYRSAVYVFSEAQKHKLTLLLNELQKEFKNQLITKILPFESFKPSREQITSYYYKNPKKPFCETFINPKLKLIRDKFSKHVVTEKLNHLKD